MFKNDRDLKIIADGLHDIASAIRELSRALSSDGFEPESHHEVHTYLDGTPVK